MLPSDLANQREQTQFAVLLFTDICDSTALKAKHGALAYRAVAELHNALFERLAAEEKLTLIKNTGDGYFARTTSVAAAVRFALRFQHGMRSMAWPGFPLTTRVGIHAGEVVDITTLGQADVLAPAADLVARVMSLAVGGQILLTRGPFDEARHFVREHPDAGESLSLAWLAHGPYLCKGCEEPVDVFEVGAADRAPLTAPPDGEKAKRVLRPGDEETLGWRPAEGLEVPGRTGWRLVEKLGAGGFGEVWAGVRDKTRERRAFKFCFDAERLRALKREVTLTRLLRETLGEREDIVRIYDLRLDEPPYFLESELATDGNMLQWAERQGGLEKIPLADRIELVAATAAAIGAAHSVGVLHKDIKPTNVLIFTGADGRAHPRLVDFGIGTLADSSVLAQHGITGAGFTGATIQHSSGTPTYSPPEYLAGRPFTVQGDVYSLGVMLWQLVTGKSDAPLAEGWQRDVPDELLREDIAACVDGDPTHRLPSATELTTRLRTLDKRRAERASKRAAAEAEMGRRKRQRALMFAAAFSILITAIAVPLTLWAVREKGNAEKATGRAVAGETKAEAALKESRRMLAEAAQSDRAAAWEFQKQGRYRDALAHLARAIGYEPESSWAAEQAVALENEVAFEAPVVTLAGHDGEVENAQFSPDGTRIVTTSRDITARVWDARSGKLVFTLTGHKYVVRRAQFSPDGTRIVTTSTDKTARVWDAQTGGLIFTLVGHEQPVESAYFHPDGTLIVTASLDKAVRIWDARTGKSITTLAHDDDLWDAQLSPDGSQIVTATHGKTARVWDTHTGKPVAVLAGHQKSIRSARFSPDGLHIVTASDDETARIWDSQTGKTIATFAGDEGGVRRAEYSPDGSRIVTVSGRTARVWDASNGKFIATLARHEGGLSSAQFSPDGLRILTIYGDQAELWTSQTGELVTIFAGHESFVSDAQFSPDGLRIVTASSDKTARIWSTQTGKPSIILGGHGGQVGSAYYSPDGLHIVTAAQDRTARVWDAQTGKSVATLAGHEYGLRCARFSPDGSRIVTASSDKTARLWDAQTGGNIATLAGHKNVVEDARFSPDGSRIVTASLDHTARVWNAQTGKLIATLIGHESSVSRAEFSPDGTRIVTASWDDTARTWDSQTGKHIATLAGHKSGVRDGHFSLDGKRIVTASFDKTARVWDVQTGKHVATLAGHKNGALSADFSSDGTRIVTVSSYDKTAWVWDAQTGTHVATLTGYRQSVADGCFSPSGLGIVTTWGDGSIARVRIACGSTAPPPPWFPSFLRLIANRTHNANGELSLPSLEQKSKWREGIMAALATEQSRYAEIARWHLAPWPDKPVFPSAKVTAREAADDLISSQADIFQIERAFALWALHPLVHLALARYEKDETRAEFLRKLSLERLLPKTPPAEQPALRKRAADLLDQQPGQEKRAGALRGEK